MKSISGVQDQLEQFRVNNKHVIYFESIAANSPCTYEANSTFDMFKAAKLSSGDQNIASVTLVFKDGFKVSKTKISEYVTDNTGKKICSGHSERIALKDAINEAIGLGREEFAGIANIFDDFNKINMHGQIKILQSFNKSLAILEQIKIYTEREPCSAAHDSCDKFFSEIFNGFKNYIFYYSVPNASERQMSVDLLMQRKDVEEVRVSGKIDEYLKINYKNIDNNKKRDAKNQQIQEYKIGLENRRCKKDLDTTHDQLKTEQANINLKNCDRLFTLCRQIEEGQYKYSKMNLEVLKTKRLDIKLHSKDFYGENDLSDIYLQIKKCERKLIKSELSLLKYELTALKMHNKIIAKDLKNNPQLIDINRQIEQLKNKISDVTKERDKESTTALLEGHDRTNKNRLNALLIRHNKQLLTLESEKKTLYEPLVIINLAINECKNKRITLKTNCELSKQSTSTATSILSTQAPTVKTSTPIVATKTVPSQSPVDSIGNTISHIMYENENKRLFDSNQTPSPGSDGKSIDSKKKIPKLDHKNREQSYLNSPYKPFHIPLTTTATIKTILAPNTPEFFLEKFSANQPSYQVTQNKNKNENNTQFPLNQTPSPSNTDKPIAQNKSMQNLNYVGQSLQMRPTNATATIGNNQTQTLRAAGAFISLERGLDVGDSITSSKQSTLPSSSAELHTQQPSSPKIKSNDKINTNVLFKASVDLKPNLASISDPNKTEKIQDTVKKANQETENYSRSLSPRSLK